MDDSAPIQNCLKALYASLDEAVCFIERLPRCTDGGRDYRYLGMNATMLTMFGIEDLTGQTVRDNFPDEIESWYEDYDRVLDTGRPVRIQRRSDPQGMVIEMFVSRVEDGADNKLVVVMRDVTDVQTAQEALQNAQANLRILNETLERRIEERTAERDRMWDSSPDLMVEATLDGVYLRANPAWAALLGYAPEEVVGRTAEFFTHDEDHQRMMCALETAQADRLPSIELRFRRKDGSYRWIQWVAAPSGGRIFALGRDFSAAKAAQERLRETEDQLRQSQKMEAVGQLTGGIAHDFNNMLTGIIGSLELLERQLHGTQIGEDSRTRRYIEAATSSAHRAAALTHRLLAFSRRQSLDVGPTDINALAAGMEDLLRRTLGENIWLNFEFDQDAWLASTDSNQFESALLNLTINARDAMPEGGQLSITSANRTIDAEGAAQLEGLEPGDYVSVRVTDTGSGMTPEVVSRVFEPFFTTKPAGSGTGLGLSMIYGFARQTGGHVSIESETGHGTTVELLFPRSQEEPTKREAPILQQEVGSAIGKSVLIAEDDAAVRMLLQDMVREMGCEVHAVADGPAALDAASRLERIDLLVTDIGLPGLNGASLAEKLRGQQSDLKILFVSGYAEQVIARREFLRPDMEWLAKPFELESLAAKISEMLA